MKTLSRFVSKFTSLIVAVLSCFDRVIFLGHSVLAVPCELEYFVDYVLRVRGSDFMKTMPLSTPTAWSIMPGTGRRRPVGFTSIAPASSASPLLFLAATGSMICGYASKTSAQLAEKLIGKESNPLPQVELCITHNSSLKG